jgi:hypothetical protein
MYSRLKVHDDSCMMTLKQTQMTQQQQQVTDTTEQYCTLIVTVSISISISYISSARSAYNNLPVRRSVSEDRAFCNAIFNIKTVMYISGSEMYTTV